MVIGSDNQIYYNEFGDDEEVMTLEDAQWLLYKLTDGVKEDRLPKWESYGTCGGCRMTVYPIPEWMLRNSYMLEKEYEENDKHYQNRPIPLRNDSIYWDRRTAENLVGIQTRKSI